MRFCRLLVLVLVSHSILLAGEAAALVVHEWGVWVRGQTSQGTCLSAPVELIQDLPPFVFRLAKEYSPKRQDHGWDKPVLHLYGPEGLAVTVRIMTPQGRLTAYYPGPRLLDETATITSRKEMMVYSLTDCIGLEWSGTLTNQEPNRLSPMPPDHWWGALRKVPGAYIKTARGTERFLFYEATALQEPLLCGQVKADELILKNEHAQPCGPVLVIVNDGKNRFMRVVERISGKGEARLAKADLLKEPCDDTQILHAARTQWEAFGVTKEEATAIVESWRADLLKTPGFLVVSRLPAEVYDGMFPLTVTPSPQQIVRAGVVFDTLPGEAARMGWLPALNAVLESWSKELEHAEFEVRERAVGRFIRLGDLPRPFLEKLAKADLPETQAIARSLLERLKPVEAGQPLLKAGRRPTPLREK